MKPRSERKPRRRSPEPDSLDDAPWASPAGPMPPIPDALPLIGGSGEKTDHVAEYKKRREPEKV